MPAAYIVAATRTAGGRKGGKLAGWHPADLGGAVLNSILDKTGADPALVEDVIMGCVGQVGEQSLNVARGAVLASRLPESVPATSVDRQCGSSQQALHFAAQAVMAGSMDIVIASGVESMTRVPMGLSVTLAVSLHAPDDELRDTLVPVNQRWKVSEVLGAAWDYAGVTGRRVSIEYALIRDINDQAWRADRLGSLLAGRLAHVNLIPLNPTPGSKWTASRPGVQREFVRRLSDAGVPVTVRDTRGREIDGACGQLAASARP